MTRNQDHTRGERGTRRWPKVLLFATLGCVLLVVLALVATQTGWFRSYVRDKIVSTVNENIDGILSIESLDGNLYSNLALNGVSLVHAEDTLLTVQSITIRYDLWNLIRGNYNFDSLTAVSPIAFARQDASGTWNWSRIILTDTSAGTSSTAASGTTSPVAVRHARIIEGSIAIASPDTLLNAQIDNLTVVANGGLFPDGPHITIDNLSLMAETPQITVRQLSASGEYNSTSLRLDTLRLATRQNLITGSGQVEMSDPVSGSLSIACDSLDLSEFAAFTGGYQPSRRLNLKADVDLIGDSLQSSIAATLDQQRIALQGWLNGISGIAEADSLVTYDLQSHLQSVALRDWLPDGGLPGVLTGTLRIDGRGFDPASAVAHVEGGLSRGSLDVYRFDTLSLQAQYSAATTPLSLDVAGRYGRIHCEGTLSEILEHPGYDLQVAMRSVNLAALPGADTLSTNLNGLAQIEGEGFDPDSLTAHIVATLYRSRIGSNRLDTLFADVRINPTALEIDTLGVRSTLGTLHASGTLGRDKSGTLHIGGAIDDISGFAPFVGADSLNGHGTFTGDVTGRLDSLSFAGAITGNDLSYDGYTARSSTISLTGLFTDSLEQAEFDAVLSDLTAFDYAIDSARAAGGYANDIATADVQITIDTETSVALSLSYQSDSVSHVDITSFDLAHRGHHWRSPSAPTRIDLFDDRVAINGFRLNDENRNATAGGGPATLSIDGVYGYDSTQTFTVGMTQLDVASIRDLADITPDLAGQLSAVVHTSGSILNPAVDGHARLSDGIINGYAFDSVNTAFSYQDTTAVVLAELHVNNAESLTVAGTIPLQPLVDSLSHASDSGLDVRIRSYGFTLNILKSFGYDIEQAQGDLRLDLHMTRSLVNPSIVGSVTLDNGTLNAPDYGINYTGISARVDFDSSTVTLEHLRAKRDKGTLSAQGQIRYANGYASGTIDAGHFTLTADKFYLVRHRHYQAEISAHASVDGNLKTPTYDGTVTVLRSNFYIPALAESNTGTTADEAELPMLVAATRDTTTQSDTLAAVPASPADTLGKVASEVVQNLRGRLTVTFPRNTWLYDEDMRVEIAGALDIVKESPAFEVFGTIDVVRGYYDLYGRRFTIKDGTLTFDGGDSINPKIAIDAVYNFRTPAREKKQLLLTIGGRAETPELQFSLDDATISEGDAVSYLLFGQNLDALTSGQRKAVIGENGSKSELARGAITNLLAGKLTETLGKEFSLDVIEINAQSDWRSASFLVGKYLTTDLFVSYQRGVGTARDQDEIVPEIVTLEYELSRHLFFQLVAGDARSSGFDVIVKFGSR